VPPTQQTFVYVPPAQPFWRWVSRWRILRDQRLYVAGGAAIRGDPQSRAYYRLALGPAGQTAKIVANFFPAASAADGHAA